MIRTALIDLQGENSSGLKTPWQEVAGLAWLTRWILTASRAGVTHSFVIGGDLLEPTKARVEPRIVRSGVKVSWIHRSHVDVFRQMVRSLQLPPTHLWMVSLWNAWIPKQLWANLQESSLTARTWVDERGPFAAIVQDKDLLAFSSRFAQGDELLGEISRQVSPTYSQGVAEARRLNTGAKLKSAEQKLYRDLMKDTEGFMSRHVERKISFAITKLLVMTPLTPNAVSIFNIALGVWSGFLLSVPDRATQVQGALLFLWTSILDGCDGEIARLKFLESRWGGWLDFWGDNVVHVAVFWGIALGVGAGQHYAIARTLGFFAVAGTLGSSLFVFFKSLKAQKSQSNPFFTSVTQGQPDPMTSPLAKIDDFLTRRDFIYLVVALAAIGKLEWFLWMSAIGSPLFFVTLLFIHAKESFPGEKIA